MFPPHLPPPSSSLRLHRFSKRFIFCLTILFLGVIAGGSGAAMMLGWIWPVVGVGEMGINSFSRPTIHSPVDETIRKETLDKMVTVYRAPTMVGEVSLLNPADRLGEAVALSSEGWFVMHAKEGDDANNKNLRVVTPSGVIYLVEKVFLIVMVVFYILKFLASRKVYIYLNQLNLLRTPRLAMIFFG